MIKVVIEELASADRNVLPHSLEVYVNLMTRVSRELETQKICSAMSIKLDLLSSEVHCKLLICRWVRLAALMAYDDKVHDSIKHRSYNILNVKWVKVSCSTKPLIRSTKLLNV